MTTKPTLVLLHGHGVSPVIWDLLHSSLSQDYAIIRPDLSRLTSHNSVEAYAEEVYGQISSSDIGPCVLIGHSMGGYVALALAAAHPDRVRGLVLFNSTAFADPDTDEQRQKRDDAKALLETRGGLAFVEKSIPQMFSDASHTTLANDIKQIVEAHKILPAEALLAGLQAIRTRPDRSGVLANAPFPVLLIAGRHDTAIPFERSEDLHKKLPNADYVVLERSGHMGMIEEPEASLLALKAFLEKV